MKPLLADIRGYLKYLELMGVEGLPFDDGATAGFKDDEPEDSAALTLQDVRKEIGDCTRCKLCKGRTNIVFGAGSPKAGLVFVGEGPGRDEDIKGLPFVGAAGAMLTRIIERVLNLTRDDVYIANIVKCRPPNNRNPEPDEIFACMPFLEKQLEVIKPALIVALGNVAAKSLIGTKTGITALRGRFHYYSGGIKIMPTYHPAFLLRNPAKKRETYEDMLMVKAELEAIVKDADSTSPPEPWTP